jgi:AraC-like DNA-binding protein
MQTQTVAPTTPLPRLDPFTPGSEHDPVVLPLRRRPETLRCSAAPPAVVYQLAPPYHRPIRCREVSGEYGDLPAGSVLMVEVSSEPRDWGVLHGTLRRLRTEAPLCPLALRIDPLRVNVLNAAIRIAQMPVRAVIGDDDYPRALRRQLTRPADLPGDVVEWLTLRGIRLTPSIRHLLHGIFALAPHSPTVAPLLVRIGTSESSARFRLQKKCLPPPGRWLQAARALNAALHLQSRPDRALLPLALSLGYADHSALSHLLGRAFGVRPAEIRERLGWEWLLDRWLRSSVRRFRESPDA